MGNAEFDDVAPGWIDVWRLWRHCLCRHGWYPLFVAPLVTCACLLDVYSSAGCDFVRLDVGFEPTNDVWEDSHAQLGLFGFDGGQADVNKWKRSLNSGCRPYSESFQSSFIAADRTWHASRIAAWISGAASLLSLATVWLLTITPLLTGILWPGVLLPAVVLAALAGAAKFVFFNSDICTEPLWFADETSRPVAARSCDVGGSSVFGIAAVAAHVVCAAMVCFRSPQKRELDENFGRRVGGPGSVVTPITAAGIANAAEHGRGEEGGLFPVDDDPGIKGGWLRTLEDKRGTPRSVAPTSCCTSDMTWSGWSNRDEVIQYNERMRDLGTLPPATILTPRREEQWDPPADADWNSRGRSIVVTINDGDRGGEPRGARNLHPPCNCFNSKTMYFS